MADRDAALEYILIRFFNFFVFFKNRYNPVFRVRDRDIPEVRCRVIHQYRPIMRCHEIEWENERCEKYFFG